jgi:hypothetical protein
MQWNRVQPFEKKEILHYETTWVKLLINKPITEINATWLQLYEASKILTFIQPKKGRVVIRNWGRSMKNY